MARFDLDKLRSWTSVPVARFMGGNHIELLQGGDALFPRMCQAIDAAEREVWLATYIFHDDPSATQVMQSLAAAARRGVAVHVVVDGFGTKGTLAAVRQVLLDAGVQLEVFRPIERWYAWLQPGQLRRLHQKLCVCDRPGTAGEHVAFVGGINLIADRLDLRHGWTDAPRLDYAVGVQGPLAEAVHATARAMWARAHLWHGWRDGVRQVVKSAQPVKETVAILRQLRPAPLPEQGADAGPMRAAFIVRDNLRQRRAIERAYVEAIRGAQQRVELAVPYFYPGRMFRRALRNAAKRGVQVRLLLQGKIDYRIAAMAARALYDELRAHGVQIWEYTPAYLHAKVAVVDDNWATVGSSNIDPLSLLLNLEANVVVRDAGFCATLRQSLEQALAVSTPVTGEPARKGLRGWMQRAAVAWAANVYLRIAGITGRY
jgi:cardiolipin synthase A/B